MLNHGIISYGYRIETPTTPGTIDVDALKAIGLEPGPKYQEVKLITPLNLTGKFINLMNSKERQSRDQLSLYLVIQSHVLMNTS